MKKMLLASAIALGCVGFGAAQAQAPVADVVAVRQASMGLLGGTFAALRAAVANKTEPKGFAGAGSAISNFGNVIPGLFPQGSGANTKALPAIWTDWAAFQKAAADLSAVGEQVKAAAAANDPAMLAAAVEALGKACAGCHTPFRGR